MSCIILLELNFRYALLQITIEQAISATVLQLRFLVSEYLLTDPVVREGLHVLVVPSHMFNFSKMTFD